MHAFLADSTIQLVPDATLLLHLVMIWVMVVILNRTLLKPVNRILSEREAEIQKGISGAQALGAERETRLEKYNATLRDARGDGYRLLEKERAQALSEKELKVKSAKAEIKNRVSETIESTRAQKQKLTGELESQAQALGAEITSQILRPDNRSK